MQAEALEKHPSRLALLAPQDEDGVGWAKQLVRGSLNERRRKRAQRGAKDCWMNGWLDVQCPKATRRLQCWSWLLDVVAPYTFW
jgi:hypothetical protein